MGFKKMDSRQHWVKQSGESCSQNSPGKGCSGNGSCSCPPSLGGDRGLNAGHVQTYRQCMPAGIMPAGIKRRETLTKKLNYRPGQGWIL